MQPSPRAVWLSRSKIIAAAFLVIPILSACIESEAPLSTAKFIDDSIVGHWRGDDGSKNILELNIDRAADGSYVVEQRERNDKKPTNYVATLTHGNRKNYVNLAMPHPSLNEQKGSAQILNKSAYMLFQYNVVNGKLHVWANDFDRLRAAMQAKQIAGSANETTWGHNMLVTSGGATLLKMFDAPDGGKFFKDELVFSHTNNLRDDVIGTLQAQADAWNAGDLDKFMTAYQESPNITFVSSDGEMRGYAALQERYRKRYGTNKDTMGKLSFSDLEVTELGDHHAMCVGHWLVERADKTTLKGMFSLVLKQIDGKWKIIHDHTSLFPSDK